MDCRASVSRLSVVLVYNESSGGAFGLEQLRGLFDECHITIEKAVPLSDGFEKKLKHLVTSDEHVIAVVGGDGTQSAVANVVANTRSVLLPLPGGTLNNFTKDLGVPQDMHEALQRATTLKPRSVDIAEVNGLFFVNNSSIGLYPHSLQTRRRLQKFLGKWPAAFLGACRAFVRFRTYTITIGDSSAKTPFVFVGNNDYGLEESSGWNRDAVDQGILSIYMVKTTSRLGLFGLFIATLIGRHHRAKSFDYRKTAQVTIDSRKHNRVHVSHDGEVTTMEMPLQYKLHKASLRVIA